MLLYIVFMLTINVINYKKKNCIKVFIYIFFIFNKIFITKNDIIFKNLKVV